MGTLTVSASVQSGGTVSAGTSTAGLRPQSRTFSLTGIRGTTFVRGDVVAIWGSNDGGESYQPLRTAQNDVVQLNYYNPETVIDDACDHYATQRLAVGAGSALAAIGFNGEAIYINPSPAWVQGGNSGFAPVGILGTTDAVPFRIIAQGVDIFDSDGSTTALGNTEVGVPGNSLQLAAGAGGGQFAVSGTGTLDIQTATGALTIDSTTGAISIGAGATAKDVTVGSITGASTTRVRGGTGGVGLGDDAVDHPVTVGSVTGVSLTSIQGGTGGISIQSVASGTINIGTIPVDHTVTVGSTTGVSLLTLQGGTGGVTVQPAATGPLTAKSGTTGAATFDSGSTGAVHLGDGASAKTVTIGSITGAAATALRAGTGGLTIVNNGVTWTWPTAVGAAGTKLTDAAGNGVLSWA